MKVSSSFAPVPVNISMSDEDVKSINNVLDNLRTLFNWLDEHKVNDIISYSTGEVINICEIKRVRGILDGLANQQYWHG